MLGYLKNSFLSARKIIIIIPHGEVESRRKEVL